LIRVHVPAPALQRVRVAVSPLWEAVGSLDALLSRRARPDGWPYDAWSSRARVLVDGGSLAGVVEILATAPGRLRPLPVEPDPPIERQLAGLTGVPAACQRAIEAYWYATIAPYWPTIRAGLDDEVRRLGKAMVTEGPQALLAALPGERVRWRRPLLTIHDGGGPTTTRCTGQLTVVPSFFARDQFLWAHSGGDFAFSFPARTTVLFTGAVSAEASAREPRRRDRLALLVGRARSSVLRALAVVPTTTSTLSQSLGLSASTVSEHLSTLLAAGVVQRRRVGVRVLYELDDAGVELLRCFDEAN
jgi:DNA-binding transcriptional ArsR family regulator